MQIPDDMRILSDKDLESPNLKVTDYITKEGIPIVKATWYSEDKMSVESIEVFWHCFSFDNYSEDNDVKMFIFHKRVYFQGPRAFSKVCAEYFAELVDWPDFSKYKKLNMVFVHNRVCFKGPRAFTNACKDIIENTPLYDDLVHKIRERLNELSLSRHA